MAQAREDNDMRFLSLDTVDETVSKVHKMKKDYIRTIRKNLTEIKHLVPLFASDKKRGRGSSNFDMTVILLLNEDHQAWVFCKIEDHHVEGMTVTNRMLRYEI